MIKRGCEIIGLPVICLNNSCKVMEVKDIVYDQQSNKLIAIVIEEGKFFHEKRIIRIENIISIEEEKVNIYDNSQIEKVQINPLIHFMYSELLGREILLENGKSLGFVQDVIIDLVSVQLVSIVITEGIFDDLMDGRPILPINKKLSFIEDSLVISNSMGQSIIYNTGGFKKIMSLE